MPKPDHDPSLEHEPHLRGGPAAPDPSEEAADRILDPQQKSPDSCAEDSAKHSVFDEPNIFPGRKTEVIAQDWSCSKCGYHLRGLPTGRRCPECGHIELYQPPPPGKLSFGEWYRERKSKVSVGKSWMILGFAAMLSWPWAVIGVLFNRIPNAMYVIAMGPAVDEVLKLAATALIVEVRPYWIKRTEQIWVAALVSSIGFASVENALSFALFVTAPSFDLILWRWLVCTGLHLTCTAIAVSGLTRAWQLADQESRAPQVSHALTPLVFAIIFHGLLNGLVAFLNLADYGF